MAKIQRFLSQFSSEQWLIFAVGLAVALVVLLLVSRLAKWFQGKETPKEDPFQIATPEDKRKTQRRIGRNVEVVLSNDRGKTLLSKAYVVDRSSGGLRLSSVNRIPVDIIIQVRATTEVTLAWMDVRVKHCNKVKDRWEIGCEFLKPPSYTDLLQFG